MHVNRGELYLNAGLLDELAKAQCAPITNDQYRTMEPMTRKERKGWMRNQPCPCGSKKKFKRCHWSKPEELHQ